MFVVKVKFDNLPFGERYMTGIDGWTMYETIAQRFKTYEDAMDAIRYGKSALNGIFNRAWVDEVERDDNCAIITKTFNGSHYHIIEHGKTTFSTTIPFGNNDADELQVILDPFYAKVTSKFPCREFNGNPYKTMFPGETITYREN